VDRRTDGRTDVPTDGWTFPPLMLFGRLGGVDLTRMWAIAQRDGHPAEYRWRTALNAAKFGSLLLLDCRAVMLPIGERKTWRTQSEFCTWQNSVRKQQPLKIYICLPAQVRAKHCEKFGWLPLSDVAAVTKPRRESR